MKLLIVIEGKFIRLLLVKGTGKKASIAMERTLDLAELGLVYEEINNAEKIMPHLKSALVGLKFNRKNVKVIFNNRMVISRELRVPKTKKIDEMNKLVINEMKANLLTSDEFIVDYSVMEPDSSQPEYERVMGMAIQAKTVQAYLDMFAKLKLTVKGIHSGYESFLQLIKEQKPSGLSLYFDVSQTHIRLYLYDNDQFVLMRNLRYYDMEADDSAMIQRIIAENISKVEQFLYVRRRSASIENLYFVGNHPELNYFCEANEDVAKVVKINRLQDLALNNAHEYIGSWGIATNEKLKNGYFKQLDSITKEAVKSSVTKKFFVTQGIVCASLLLLSVVGTFGADFFFSQKEAKLESKVYDYENSKTYQDVLAMKAELAAITAYNEAATVHITSKITSPIVTQEMFALIVADTKIKVLDARLEANTFEFTADTATEIDIVAYVQRLIDSELFESVHYDEFGLNEQKRFEFVVTCTLAGGTENESE